MYDRVVDLKRCRVVGIWEIEVRFCSWVCPHTVRPQSLCRLMAAGASWQVPTSHNFRLMDPLGYAAREAQKCR